jgi:SAM-dependent methyltransferase
MTGFDFTPIASDLRAALADFYRQRGTRLSDPGVEGNLRTHSELVESRAQPLLEVLYRRTGLSSIEGMSVLELGCRFGSISLYFAACGARVVGIEPEAAYLSVGRAVASRHRLPAEFRSRRLKDLDLPEFSFDLAFVDNSLLYVIKRHKRLRALSETLHVLRPGGHLVVRSVNRWHPRDPLTGLPLIQLLPPEQAKKTSKRLGRRRQRVRITSPPDAARELRAAGFTGVHHVASPSSRWPGWMKHLARYQHLVAERPGPDRGGAGFQARGSRRRRSAAAPKFQHLINTRYAIKGMYYDHFSEEWLQDRLRLFRRYCVPGVARQTNGDFSWLVFCDETVDDGYLDSLRESARLAPQFRLVITSHASGVRDRDMAESLLDDDTEVLITTRLDNDDVLHPEAIAVIQSYLGAFVHSPHERWALNFPRGFRYDENSDRLYASYWPHGAFMSVFEKLRTGEAIFNASRAHPKMHARMPLHFEESIPGWLQVIHGRAESTGGYRAGAVVTAGNVGTVVKPDMDLEVDPAEMDDAFRFAVARSSEPIEGGAEPPGSGR